MKTHIKKCKYLKGYIIVSILISCLLTLPSNFVFAADYPDRSINFLLPYGPGGIIDIVARALVSAANKHINQQIVAINRPVELEALLLWLWPRQSLMDIRLVSVLHHKC